MWLEPFTARRREDVRLPSESEIMPGRKRLQPHTGSGTFRFNFRFKKILPADNKFPI